MSVFCSLLKKCSDWQLVYSWVYYRFVFIMKKTLFSSEKMFCFAVGLLLVEPRTAQHSFLVKCPSFNLICRFVLLVSCYYIFLNLSSSEHAMYLSLIAVLIDCICKDTIPWKSKFLAESGLWFLWPKTENNDSRKK